MFVDAADEHWLTKERLCSIMKLFCGFCSCIALYAGYVLMAAFLILGYLFWDIIDGPMAQTRPCWKPSNDAKRRLLDNVSDLIAPLVVSLVCFHVSGMSLWWWAPLFIRELLIARLAASTLRRSGGVVFPNAAHKGAKLFLALAGIAVMLQWHAPYFLIGAYAGLYLTLADYYGFFKRHMPHDKHAPVPTVSEIRPAIFEGLRYLLEDIFPGPKVLTAKPEARRLKPAEPED